MSEHAGLYIVATPIGNLQDISKRAVETLSGCDFIICENPKHSLRLLNKLGIKKKLISMHDYNEEKIIKVIANDLITKKIALISDAGSPLISDPGYKLVRYCIKENIRITSIPGPSSIIPALQISGIPINEFYFAGFFPKTKKKIENFINEIKNSEKTSVFFVSNHKLEICLEALKSEVKKRLISVSKELTKINEKVFIGTGQEIKSEIFMDNQSLKGEFVVVVEGKSHKKSDLINLHHYEETINILLSKFSLTDVAEIVHKLLGIKKNKIYKWLLSIKKP